MELGHELGHFRESIILRGAKKIDPDEELEKKMSLKRYDGVAQEGEKTPSKGKDRGKDKGKDKGKGKGKAGKSEEQREPGAVGGGSLHNDVSANGEEGLSTYSDVTSGNGASSRPREVDHYGFLYSMSEADMHYTPVMEADRARDRERKWLGMLSKWDIWIGPKKFKLKERCRKGIPSSVRGRAWQYLCGAHEMLAQNKGLFDDLLSRPDPDIVVHVIDKDLDRTFPSHVLFAKAGSQGQQDLRKVLKAYAIHDPKTGYCQAMAPVAATLLMHMTAEEAFWCLVQICDQYLPGYYSPGLHAFQIDAMILKDLLGKYLPNIKSFMDSKLPPNPDEATHKRGLDPVLYCTEWYMSMFSRSLPWPTVLRVWDMFFFEGVKVLHKTALALIYLTFASSADRKDCKEFFQLTKKLRDLSIKVTHEDVLIPTMMKFRVHRRDLQLEHIAMADLHFSEERARIMEAAARQRLRTRSTFSVQSDMSDI